METSNSMEDEATLTSTVAGARVTASGEVIIDSTLNNRGLTPLHPVAMEAGRGLVSVQQLDSTVQSSGVVDVVGEPMPGPSGVLTGAASSQETSQPAKAKKKIVRKSRRLELSEQEPKASQRKREYKSQEYSLDMLWCDECMRAYESQCPTHMLHVVPDKVVLSRAWASSPPHIQIFKVPQSQLVDGESSLGVYAKRPIQKYTQFGPFSGHLVDSLDQLERSYFPLMLEHADGERSYFETSDENRCNWMMFVRPAKTFSEQNLVAYQYKQDVFFTVTKLVENKQELKVWYAAHYAERMGLKALELTEADVQALDEEDAKFPCFECSRKFKSSAALQKHLGTHEADDIINVDPSGGEDEDFEDRGGGGEGRGGGGGGKRKATFVRGKLLKGKGRDSSGDTSNYQWKKKKSTKIYLHKTLKKYKKRPCPDKILQNMKGMYKRQGKVSGGNEWVCTHCHLTFDNGSLLNMHTLTHAAEDLGMDEVQKMSAIEGGKVEVCGDDSNPQLSEMVEVGEGEEEEGEAGPSGLVHFPDVMHTCPKCKVILADRKELMEHVATHAHKPGKKEKPFECGQCCKSFSTEEKLLRHHMVHGDESSKPLECPVCMKRVMNNSALACHMKTHSEKKYYDCPVCGQDFDMAASLKEHGLTHMDSFGRFPCTACSKCFHDFSFLKKHMKTFHSDKVYQCPECTKVFPRIDKLRLHMLRHTTHREFMCETCGRQFKRKDKLKEHMKRMHSKERMEQQQQLAILHGPGNGLQTKKFTPKVMPTEFHRFIYKCHPCLLGFKRRGMLVNHLAKRHPEIKPEHVPELNLPILKTQKDFFCQYCDKVYKSSSKRKAHILKNHPGLQVPPSSRKSSALLDGSGSNLAANSFSHTVGSITTMPHGCKFCHKQYASKAKLLQHQRKKHADLVEPVPDKRKVKKQVADSFLHITVGDGNQSYEAVPMAVVSQTDAVPSTDLLTQAMSELQNFSEFTINPRLTPTGQPTMVHIHPSAQLQPTTIDISQLGQALQSFSAQPGGVATVLAPPPQPASPTQSVTVMGPAGSQTINLGNLSNAQFITRTWTNGFSTFR
ncbi:PR domain zinc finger protein 10 [Aplysia californica]|uniref:PR domain zinc finger protein 10 n=1 Tax=Aplysia californica TaxID=6500 RepID=A0ABM1A9G1_APLCA|nr:PR domain zinc finger protein 10 [Aplysia californica]